MNFLFLADILSIKYALISLFQSALDFRWIHRTRTSSMVSVQSGVLPILSLHILCCI